MTSCFGLARPSGHIPLFPRKANISFSTAGRQSPDPETQDPKQGTEASASGTAAKDNKQTAGGEKEDSQRTLDSLPSNPDRKARV